jgi:oligosaccharide reducing-end xylanase
MWDAETKLVKFVPEAPFTDPSYHLPHFYEQFALRADEADRPFWKEAAENSRAFLRAACNPKTGWLRI